MSFEPLSVRKCLKMVDVFVLQFNGVLSSPMDRAKVSAEIVAKYQPLVGHNHPSIQIWDELLPWDAGEWEMQATYKVRAAILLY